MSDSRPVQFANFVCRFGPQWELLDLVDEIVLPAFVSGGERSFGENKYFLHQVKLLNLSDRNGKGEPALCGRFVKDTVLKSEQIFRAGELRANNQRIASSPTAFFVLLLRSHKLIYCSEFKGSAGLDTFRSTIQLFLSRKHSDYIETLYKSAKSEREFLGEDAAAPRITKTALRQAYPRPNLDVVPLTSKESLGAFIDRFKTLQSVSIRLIKPNNELDNDGFFESYRENSEALGATTSSLTYNNPEGLTKDLVAEHAEKALTGNTEVQLKGKDNAGRELRGSNEEFNVVTFVDASWTSVRSGAIQLYNALRQSLNAGLLTAEQEPSQRHNETLARLTQQARRDDQA